MSDQVTAWVSEEMTEYAIYVICPHCGHHWHDTCDYPQDKMNDGDTWKTDCAACGMDLIVTTYIHVMYTTDVADTPRNDLRRASEAARRTHDRMTGRVSE
jgi:hypothetical protein